jgi:hypothetical protein
MVLSNWEIAVYALFLQSGGTRAVHTEDVAIKCFELARESFSWVKYPDNPDKEIARFGLMDARKEKNGALVTGRAGRGKGQSTGVHPRGSPDGWQLTEKGIAWIKEHEESLALELKQQQPKAHRQEIQQKLSRVKKHDLYKDFIDQPSSFVPSLGSLAELLRCRVDAERAVWYKRFESLRNQALLAQQQDVVDFVDACQKSVTSTPEEDL